jgi:hypothetical protein
MDAAGSTEMLVTIYQLTGGSSDLISITVFAVSLATTESDEKNNKVQESHVPEHRKMEVEPLFETFVH